MGERIQPAASAAALIRCDPPGLSDDRWIMTVAKAPKPAQHETSEWTEILTDSVAAEHVCSEHHFPGAPVKSASRVVLGTAGGTKVVADIVKRVRMMTESGERVMVEYTSANVTHPILSVSGMPREASRSCWATTPRTCRSARSDST